MAESIIDEPIEKDMKISYLDYAMSVIVGRAIPDARDGLKPVHRRILFSMYELGNTFDKPTKKSARIVGECLGKFHPHGDSAVYNSLVRMAQDFSLRYPLVDGQGNMGSIDGDSAAAMRYTEVRMARLADEMLTDLDKETVDFTPNFDGTLKEPVVLPSKIPTLLVNGSSGIAVGMATNIPPHNLTEIIDAAVAFIDGATPETLLSIVTGPDFPTGATIVGRKGIIDAYTTGRGSIRVRAKIEIHEEKHILEVKEIPYQITKTSIIESIVDAVKEKRIEGISGIHDRSDKEGISVIIDLKRDAQPEVVLNQLYAHTPLESSFGIINLVLVGKQPKVLPLYDLIREFVEFRKFIVTKRCEFELSVAKAKAHLLEGLHIALDHIEPIVQFLKSAKDTQEARAGLMSNYSLSEKQANAILDMRLQKLVSLERTKLETELLELKKQVEWLTSVLSDVSKILAIIKEELADVKSKYGDGRRTNIIDAEDDRNIEELIPKEDVVITITNKGYIKRISLTEYKTQRRSGKGIIGNETKDNDEVRDVIITHSHNYMLFFTDKGRAFWLKSYQIPAGGRYATGKTIVSLLDLKEEKVSSWISVSEFKEDEFLFMVTKKGTVKRTALSNFSNPRKAGIIAITLKENDGLVDVIRTTGKETVLIATKQGQSIRFEESDAREIGRTGQGVIGIRMEDNDEVASITICNKPTVLTITENGYGKRTALEEYRVQGRGGSGIINMKTEGRNGMIIGTRSVEDGDEILIVTTSGQTIRIGTKDLSIIGRNTQGVRVMKLDGNEKIARFAIVPADMVRREGIDSDSTKDIKNDEPLV